MHYEVLKYSFYAPADIHVTPHPTKSRQPASSLPWCVLWPCTDMKATVDEKLMCGRLGRLHYVENHALPSLSPSPQLGIRGMALWLVGREEVSLVSSVAQGE